MNRLGRVLAGCAVIGCVIGIGGATNAAPLETAIDESHQRAEETFIKDANPKLYEKYREAADEMISAMSVSPVADLKVRASLDALYAKPLSKEDAEFIVTTLLQAYDQKPPAWPLVRASLVATEGRAKDARVTGVAKDLVSHAHELPDDALTALQAAMRTLALTREKACIDLLIEATSREFMGVEAGPEQGFVGSFREHMSDYALHVLFVYLPLDLATQAVGQVNLRYEKLAQGADVGGYVRAMLQMSDAMVDRLERMKKGEPLPETSGAPTEIDKE